MIQRFLFWLMGYRLFTIGDVKVFQRDTLVDQLMIGEALTLTRRARGWCKDSDLIIRIETSAFEGEYGTTSTGEVARYRRGRNRAAIRVSGPSLNFEGFIKLLEQLRRVD
jgi:hypothetical protein